MVAVQWHERLTEIEHGERREFIRKERIIDVIKSTELGRLLDGGDWRLIAFPPALYANDDPELRCDRCGGFCFCA